MLKFFPITCIFSELRREELSETISSMFIRSLWTILQALGWQALFSGIEYIDHFPSRSVFGGKMRKFIKNGRNFCYMPEISRSEYPEFHSASFIYSSFFPLSTGKSQNREFWGKWQKFLSYARNF